jgi:hypothetical protein
MIRRAPVIGGLFTFLIAAGGAGAMADSRAPAQSNILYGVHSDISWHKDAAYRAQILDHAKTMQVKVMRIGLLWEWIEYTRGKPNWTVIDDIVNQMTAAGIRPLLVVQGSPSWANGVSDKGNDHFYLHVPTDPQAFQKWVNESSMFVSAVARRYQGKVNLWEIGNEENDAYFWRPQPNPQQYAVWYTTLRSAIKAVDQNSQVALGGLNGLGYDVDAPGMRGSAFLKAVYAAKVYPDIIAIHPYSNRGQPPDVHINGAGNFDDIDLVRGIMVANGQSDKPIWITEWGWSVDKVTPAQQALNLSKSLSLIESKYSSFVTLATYYSEFDPDAHYHYGLYTKDFVARPAADTLRRFLSR